MYQSELHHVLRDTLHDITWTPSTKDEDNFRQVLSAALFKRVSPYSIEIPSTRSGAGDIQIAGRKIEIKYASRAKQVAMGRVVEDWDSMLSGATDFCIVSIRTDRTANDDFLDNCITPAVVTPGKLPPTWAMTSAGYRDIGMFLSATFTWGPFTSATGVKGPPVYRYLPFEAAPAIARSCFLQTGRALLHVDTVGSREAGLISFLYKRADCVAIRGQSQLAWVDLKLDIDPSLIQPGAAAPVLPLVARHASVTVDVPTRKTAAAMPLCAVPAETDVPLFDLR